MAGPFVEILTVLVLAVVVGGVVGLAANWINPWSRRLEEVLNLAGNSIIFFTMWFSSAEVIGRQFFNHPIPGHLDLSEILMPPIVFLGLAHTQSVGGHIRMTLVLDALPPRYRKLLDLVTDLLSVAIYVILCYFSAVHAYRSWLFQDTTSSPPYFLMWPSVIIVPIGLFFTVLRLYLQIVHNLFPQHIKNWDAVEDAIPYD